MQDLRFLFRLFQSVLKKIKSKLDDIKGIGEVKRNELLKTLNIKETDYAFEVSISLEPAEGADVNQFHQLKQYLLIAKASLG